MNRVVPMPSFTDPNLPEAAGGSINFGVAGDFPSFENHPVQHSRDYASGLLAEDAPTLDENDRDGWNKPQWVDLAGEYGLPTSGNKDELIARVLEHEASLDREGSD